MPRTINAPLTMAISTIRRFTDDDASALDASAQRFTQRHGISIEIEECTPTVREALEFAIWSRKDQRLKRLWQGCMCRALGVGVDASITVAHGFIGYRVHT
jgi:hypothetical protein